MEPRLIKGVQADYVPAEYEGSDPGLEVYGNNVLVKVDHCSPVSAGGVMLTDDMAEKMTLAAETGAICAVGEAAFTYFKDGTRWMGSKPELGDRIYFERYAGVPAKGRDGASYRIMSDQCIVAGLAEDARSGLHLVGAA